MDKLVSVLIPTRQRTKQLISSVMSLMNRAQIPEEIEILLKFDNDDHQSVQEFLSSYFVQNCKVVVSPQGKGYADLHHGVNDLCKIASGEFLFLFNDDADMRTGEWDKYIRPHAGKFCVLRPNAGHKHGNLFPIVHRKWLEHFGYLSLSCQMDAWVQEVSRRLEIEIDVPQIVIYHKKNPNWKELYQTVQFHALKSLREQDVRKLKLKEAVYE